MVCCNSLSLSLSLYFLLLSELQNLFLSHVTQQTLFPMLGICESEDNRIQVKREGERTQNRGRKEKR